MALGERPSSQKFRCDDVLGVCNIRQAKTYHGLGDTSSSKRLVKTLELQAHKALTLFHICISTT
jgi:hypothetical protein